MIHEYFVSHEVVVRLILTLFTLHVVCWGLVYFLAFQYELVC
jgi:hypothetical protein